MIAKITCIIEGTTGVKAVAEDIKRRIVGEAAFAGQKVLLATVEQLHAPVDDQMLLTFSEECWYGEQNKEEDKTRVGKM